MNDYNEKAIKARNLLAQAARWDKEKQKYICPHCNDIITDTTMAFGYDCNVCGLPINER